MRNKSAEAVLVRFQKLGQVVPCAMHQHLRGGPVKPPWTRNRAHRTNDHAHCEQRNWTHVRQRFRHERFGHPELVALMNDLSAKDWSQLTNHFKPTFKLLKREKKEGRTKRNGGWAARTLGRRRRPSGEPCTRNSVPLC